VEWNSLSHQLINRSPALKKLRDEGFNLEIRAGFLLVTDIPYVNAAREIKRGILVSSLDLAGDVAVAPKTHVAYFIGEYPCHHDGTPIEKIRNQSARQTFSAKPKPSDAYDDYYQKVTTYVAIFAAQAKEIDPSVKAQTALPITATEDDKSVFHYIDTASSKAGIDIITNKLALDKLAIVGTGGTGSYVLDLVAKTPVGEIHLFDKDTFLSHNAFRSPGAASLDELRAQRSKVDYLKDIYLKMRKGIVAHNIAIGEDNVDLLREMKFVFICIDKPSAKKPIVERLEEWGIPFIDVGMGILRTEESLGGTVRTTTSIPSARDVARGKISFFEANANNDYALNIQIADLNALNAAMAVIKWKKLFGFYLDSAKELNSSYTVQLNLLTKIKTLDESAPIANA
jgi:ThiF family